MRDQGTLVVECTSCRRTTHAQRSPFDPPGLALTKTQCRLCNPGFTTERYFNANGEEINRDGDLLIRQIPPQLSMMAAKQAADGSLTRRVRDGCTLR